MDKRFILAIMLVAVVSIFMFGCGNQVETPADTVEGDASVLGEEPAGSDLGTDTAPEAPAGKRPAEMGLDQIYQYGLLKEFTYRITSSGQSMTMKYSISSDTFEGKAAWLQQSDIEAEGVTSTTKIWMDKATYACMRVMSVTEVMGQTYETESECPATADTESAEGEMPSVTHVGPDSVTVPAGTFASDKYSTEGSVYWVADGVPVPVKVESAGSVMELVSYS